jgi:2,4-diketo-3-deoxy-L-fuconate hydrolase
VNGRHRIPVIHQTGLDARTRDMIFSVPELVARISAVCLMLPGNLMFTPLGGDGAAATGILAGTTLVSTYEGRG